MLRRSGVSLAHKIHPISTTSSRSLLPLICTRNISTQKRPNSTLSATDSFTNDAIYKPTPPPPASLSTLPTPYLLRTILICTVSTSPFLSNLLTKVLLSYTTFLTTNRISRYILQHTFYNHFCAGNTKPEIQSTLQRLKSWGFRGIILAYAKEVEVEGESSASHTSTHEADEADIASWKEGTLQTIRYAEPKSFVAIKYSGAGATAVLSMEHHKPASPSFLTALDEICEAAQADGKQVKLLFDAEQTRYQDAMDGYTLDLMRKYNPRNAIPTVYNTYQMYRKISPSNLKSHLELAKKEGFGFGAKVVRGAYLQSDPRDTFWSTREETDESYNSGIERLLTFENRSSGNAEGINVGVVVATHNQTSVTKAMNVLQRQKAENGMEGKSVTFAQLAGMADEVSMSVINGEANGWEKVNVVKYIPWGTMEECVKYLLRRADENKDSLKRTGETRRAAWQELWRRATFRA
ncbi:proline dehydrogenase [Orbilia ellipsospora]|uniref:Proline dehydrogenase n=1 Tax=Orbilia ellipsospora TaxID=2528407 RepID=A0AAV9XBN4_9PEZI